MHLPTILLLTATVSGTLGSYSRAYYTRDIGTYDDVLSPRDSHNRLAARDAVAEAEAEAFPDTNIDFFESNLVARMAHMMELEKRKGCSKDRTPEDMCTGKKLQPQHSWSNW